MLSIVIPNYNGERTVTKTIEKVYGMDCEIIVVDNCSTDGSVKTIKERFPKVKVLVNSKNQWVAYSRNRGMMESNGDYILLLDNDLFMDPESVLKLLDEVKDCDIAFPTVDFENGVRMHPRSEEEIRNFGISCAFMISRKTLGRLDELFDETYKFYMEDTDFFLRCRKLGMKTKYVKDAMAVHVLKDKVDDQLDKYYFRVRNMIYFCIKNGKVDMRLAKFLLNNFFINCMLNYSERLRYQDTLQNIGLRDKVKLLFNHSKLTDNRYDLFKAFFRAILWNIKNYRIITDKRARFRDFLVKNGDGRTFETVVI